MDELDLGSARKYISEKMRRDFESEHGVSIKNLQVARAIVKGNLQIIQYFVYNGELTDERIDEIAHDRKLQAKYAKMIEALDNGEDETFKRLYKDVSKRADTLCVWLAHHCEYLESSFDVNLKPRSRLDYYVDKFKENG